MKRIVVKIIVPREREFELNLQEPGVVHQFLMGYEKKKIAIAMPGMQPGQEVVEELPTLLVEIDPDGPFRKRKFLVVPEGIGLEADKLVYLGTTLSRVGNGVFVHLWEEITADA